MAHVGVSASDATVLWTQIAALLALAWLLGSLARRVGQPPIIGSLLAGLIAGPSVFGQVWPSGFHWFRPGTELNAGLLSAVAQFALLLLLIGLGAETDLPLIRGLGRSAASVIGWSLVPPLAVGAGIALLLPHVFVGPHAQRTSFVLLIAAAMAVSSLPVIARIMTEMGMTRRNVGQLSVAAATVNDGVGFVVLALATALVGSGGTRTLVVAVVGLVALVAVLATAGQRLLDAVVRRSRRHGPDVPAGIGICVVFTLLVAAVAQALGVDAALGAFLAGIVIGRSRFVPPRVLDGIRWMSDAVFAPLYFATAGVSVDVALLGHGSTGWWFLIVLLAATGSKFVSVFAGARLAGLPAREATSLGAALNGRGALQVILATAGLTAGILSASAFTVVILLSIVSSLVVPPAVRRALRDWRGTEEEQQRLEHEEEMTSNVVVRGQRLLLPSRGSTNSVAAARVLDLAWPESSEVTLLRVAGAAADDHGLENVRSTLAGRTVREECAEESEVVDAILAEANLGYGVIAVGAAEQPSEDQVLPPFIDDLLNFSPIPLLIVRRGDQRTDERGRPVLRPRRILVPITGNAASRAGQEVAQTISTNTGAELSLLHVVTRPGAADGSRRNGSRWGPMATAVVDEARQQAQDKQLPADVIVRSAAFSGEQIETEATATGADVVVMGTTVRRVSGRPLLGHTVDHLLEHLTAPTVVVVVLPDAQQAAAGEHIDRDAG